MISIICKKKDARRTLLRFHGRRLFNPFIKLFVDYLDFFRMFGCDVILFADVIIEFVELVGVIEVEVDEFPVSFTNSVGWFVA